MRTKFSGILTLLLAFVVQLTFAQEKTISGTVTDESGLPLPGVNIIVKGTTTGTQTDFDGNYSIDVASGETLVYSYVSYQSQEITVEASNTIDVSMEPSTAQLDQVVVTAFGGTKQKRATTYATVSVDDDDINTVSSTNVFENLSGKVAGANITTPAQPGASSKVILRGFSSVTGNNAPLYIVDGSPINASPTAAEGTFDRSYDGGNGISDLDPNSIASMSVLKGAAATALYGSRGANGVIIITTKRGKKNNKLSVDLSSSVDFIEVSRVPHLQNQFGQGWAGEGYSSQPGGTGTSNENGSWGPAFNGEIRPWGQIVDNSQQTKKYVALKDNIKDFYDIGNAYTNSARLSGGNEKSDFSLTLSNLTSDGVIPTDADAFNRRALSFNGGMKGEKLSVRISANYIKKDQNAVNTGQGDTGGEGATFPQEIIQVPRDISLVDLRDYKNNPFNTPGNFYTPYAQNPYFILNENGTTIKEDRFFGNINFNYTFNDHFTALWQIGGDIRNERVKSHGAIVNYPENSAQDLLGSSPIPGGVSELKRTRKEYDTYFNLNYEQSLSEDFNLNALAGINYNERQADLLSVAITGLDIPDYYEIQNTANRPVTSQQNSKRRSYGLYGQAELSYVNRYFLTLTARNDWSSTLPVDNNSYFYPSASASAVVLDDTETYLKLRAGISRVGNDTDLYYTEGSLIHGVASLPFGSITFPVNGVNAYELSSQLANPEIKPEITDEVEVGFESSFLRNRIKLDVALYNRKTSDLILNLPIERATGYATFAGNFADVENKGIELVFGATPVKNQNFKWDLNYSFTKNKNEVTNLLGGVDKVTLTGAYGTNFYAVKGQPLGVFYTTVPKKNDEGQYVVNPETGFYEPSDEEQRVGTSQRDFIMGLTNKISYKNFTLAGTFDWKQGGKMYSYTNRLLNFTGNAISTTYNDRNPFIVPNSVVENEDGTYSENTTPVSYGDVTNFYNAAQNAPIESNHVIDRTFVRLTTLSLTYSVDEKIMKQIGFRSASITLYGKNLFLWTPDDNPYVDPEVSTFGSDLSSEFGEFAGNPAQRSYGVKVNIGL